MRDPLLAFIREAAGPLVRVRPQVVADPRPVEGSLFRIYGDARFAKDKSPYQTHAAVQFRHRAGKFDPAHPRIDDIRRRDLGGEPW